ncbi:hypothetical protein VP01_2683g1 [Puccinia sorghi]|uniref:Uncharacterized protein n=1 Tax=Puccinia sorghi TaxID=27349 RepID=A0A0L6V3S6_9BASI|nr:hypothetical protein VP01_2683g1 [Puccinia sorghi]
MTEINTKKYFILRFNSMHQPISLKSQSLVLQGWPDCFVFSTVPWSWAQESSGLLILVALIGKQCVIHSIHWLLIRPRQPSTWLSNVVCHLFWPTDFDKFFSFKNQKKGISISLFLILIKKKKKRGTYTLFGVDSVVDRPRGNSGLSALETASLSNVILLHLLFSLKYVVTNLFSIMMLPVGQLCQIFKRGRRSDIVSNIIIFLFCHYECYSLSLSIISLSLISQQLSCIVYFHLRCVCPIIKCSVCCVISITYHNGVTHLCSGIADGLVQVGQEGATELVVGKHQSNREMVEYDEYPDCNRHDLVAQAFRLRVALEFIVAQSSLASLLSSPQNITLALFQHNSYSAVILLFFSRVTTSWLDANISVSASPYTNYIFTEQIIITLSSCHFYYLQNKTNQTGTSRQAPMKMPTLIQMNSSVAAKPISEPQDSGEGIISDLGEPIFSRTLYLLTDASREISNQAPCHHPHHVAPKTASAENATLGHAHAQRTNKTEATQTFLKDTSSHRGAPQIKEAGVVPSQQPGRKEPPNEHLTTTTLQREDTAETHTEVNEIDLYAQPVHSLSVVSTEPPASDHPANQMNSEPTRTTTTKSYKTNNEAKEPSSDVRASSLYVHLAAAATNNRTNTMSTNVTSEPGGIAKKAESSTSIAVTSTQELPSSVPRLTNENAQGQGILGKGALAGIAIAAILLAAIIPFSVAFFRRRRRLRQRKLSAMFDKGAAKTTTTTSSLTHPSIPSHSNIHHLHLPHPPHHQPLHVSHTEIDELMNRVASVQLPKPSHLPNKSSS